MSGQSADARPFSARSESEAEAREVGALLRRGMAELGYGPTDLSRALEITRQQVQQICRGARPLHVRHLRKRPAPLREWLVRALILRDGVVLAERLPPDERGLRSALADLGSVALAGHELLRDILDATFVTADMAAHVRGLGQRAQRTGASLIQWADVLERERVLSLEEGPNDE